MTDRARPTVCYLVFCHRQPELVRRLAQVITDSSPGAVVVVRHDRAAGLHFDALPERTRELVSDIHITWGSWQMVDAQLEAVGWVREHIDPDWTVLLSGQDHPVRDLAAWEDELVASGANGWVAARPLDPLRPERRRAEREDQLTRRYTYRWRRLPQARPDRWVHPFVRRATRAVWYRWGVLLQSGWMVNEMPRGLPWMAGRRLPRRVRAAFRPWYGEQWFALDRTAIGAVLASAAGDPDLRDRYEHSLIPDEGYFQTIVCSDPQLRIENRSLAWKHFSGSDPSPRAVTVEDVPLARAAGTPFVRKVDLVEPSVLDALSAAVEADRAGRQAG